MKLIEIIAKIERALTGLKDYKEKEYRDFSQEIDAVRNRIGDALDSFEATESELQCAKDNLDNIGEAVDELEDMLQEHA